MKNKDYLMFYHFLVELFYEIENFIFGTLAVTFKA